MSKRISLWAAAAALTLGLPLHAQEAARSAPASQQPAGVDANLVWPPELKAGRRAWSVTSLKLIDPQAPRKIAEEAPANAELRLTDHRVIDDRHWWRVEAVATKAQGWTPAESLARTWPKSAADTLAPMLGDRTAEIASVQAGLRSPERHAKPFLWCPASPTKNCSTKLPCGWSTA